MTGGPIGERQTVPRRGGSIEIAVRASESLVVVGRGEVVPRCQKSADLYETGVLVERPRERACDGLDLGRKIRIGGEECRRIIGEPSERRGIVDRNGFVSHLAFVVP